MAETTAKKRAHELPPVKVSRTLHAPREIVFAAWSSADHVKRWFAPTGYTAPQAKVEMRVGGPFEVLMRSPDGVEHRVRGKFVEVAKHDRLALDLTVEDAHGRALFRAYTEANFSDALGGTRLDVAQTYEVIDPDAAWMAEGAPQGWAQTLDKLSAQVSEMWLSGSAVRSVVHGMFSLERTYDASAERVYRALSDETAKAKWFAGEDGRWRPIERVMDFRVGGRERLRGRWESGVVSTFEATYHDIVPNERILYSYEMWLNDRKISVSLATMEIKPAGADRATLKVTEQGAFLDGFDDGGSRERGTGFLLDRLGASLAD
ncbi:MAG: SRPBCC domain-containing protein [Hyphomicrobiales bacterium]|nr:SRPBCC domain-containing protein [Hyphomicrobiales bacterium]